MFKIIKEELDKQALEEYRKNLEPHMSEMAKFIIDILQNTDLSRKVDFDRAYSRQSIKKFIEDDIIYEIRWSNRLYDMSLRRGLDMDDFNEDDLNDIALWFCGYFEREKRKYWRDDTFVKSNPHPDEKNVGDCVKRAIVHATGRDYRDVQNELNRIKREIGARKFNNREVWRELVKRYNFQRVNIPAPKRGEPRMNGHRFCVEHPKGTYLLHMAHHLTCCIDGKIYDSWDCRDKAVYQAFLVKGD